MVGGDDKRGLAPVFGHRLDRAPQFGKETVKGVGRLEIALVVAFVGPVVGLPIRDVEGAGLEGADGVQSGRTDEAVERHAAPERLSAPGRLIEDGGRLQPARAFRHLERAPDRKARTRGVEDPWQHVPVDRGGNAPVETGSGIEPLEDVGVDVQLLVVAVDPEVRLAGEEFAVAGIGEVARVRDADVALPRAVAEDLALFDPGGPEEGQQRRPALIGLGPPEQAAKGVGVPHVSVLLADQRLLRAGEDLLPAQAVGGDQKHVLRPALRREDGGHDEKREKAEQEIHGRVSVRSGADIRVAGRLRS